MKCVIMKNNSIRIFLQLGTLLALIPIEMYNGQRGNVRHKELNRWFFYYIYYPAHMVLLLIRAW